jgi:2,3-bisphosphoglycerate-independent phosphoglycerate mutase
VVTFTEYEAGLPVEVAFPTQYVTEPLAKIVSDHGYHQLHLAETEKYAHVTFFINGMAEQIFPGEERILVPSPAVASYDKKPEMAARQITDAALQALAAGNHDFYIINYANPDMVGHTGNLEATIKAVEAMDACLGEVVQDICNRGGIAFIVADHGNAEILVNLQTSEVDKEHNTSPVPLLIAANSFAGRPTPGVHNGDLSSLRPVGILADVAPTLLHTIGLPIPSTMNGSVLVEL